MFTGFLYLIHLFGSFIFACFLHKSLFHSYIFLHVFIWFVHFNHVIFYPIHYLILLFSCDSFLHDSLFDSFIFMGFFFLYTWSTDLVHLPSHTFFHMIYGFIHFFIQFLLCFIYCHVIGFTQFNLFDFIYFHMIFFFSRIIYLTFLWSFCLKLFGFFLKHNSFILFIYFHFVFTFDLPLDFNKTDSFSCDSFSRFHMRVFLHVICLPVTVLFSFVYRAPFTFCHTY